MKIDRKIDGPRTNVKNLGLILSSGSNKTAKLDRLTGQK